MAPGEGNNANTHIAAGAWPHAELNQNNEGKSASMAEAVTNSVVVLIAEDETLVRMVASEVLQDEGYQVLEAQDGREALTILNARAAAFGP